MKLKFLALALLPLTLAACQSNNINLKDVREIAVNVLEDKSPAETLAAYEWSSNTGASRPIVLHFDQQGRLSVQTTCNTLGGSWKIEHNQIITGNMISTQMACSGDAMKQEGIAGRLFDNGKTTYSLAKANSNSAHPVLTLTNANGEKRVFDGKMTPETQYGGQSETIFLEISPTTKSCTGVTAQTCLQVKEIKYNAQGIQTSIEPNWHLFYDTIQGYQHNPAEKQVIRVKRFTIQSPAADQSKYAYVHDMTVSRESIKGTL